MNPKNNKKKILILTSSYGSGHIIAARNIKAGLKKLSNDQYSITVVDFINTVNKFIGKTTEKSYLKLSQYTPSIYKFIYEKSNKKWILKAFNYLNYPIILTKTKTLLKKNNPDIIISTFPYWDLIIKDISHKYNKKTKFISVITDSIKVHQSWVISNADYFIVPNNDTVNAMKKLQINTKKIKPLGFPVNLEFNDPIDKAAFFQKIGLNPKIPTGLIVINTAANKKSLQIIEKIIKTKQNLQMIIITGKNKEIKEKLDKTKTEIPIKTFGWIDNMVPYIKTCDFVISKAGGAIVMECLAAKKPMIITQIIPGQEEGNTKLIETHKIGKIIHDAPLKKIIPTIKDITTNLEGYQKNMIRVSKPDAAIKIAQFIINQI